MLIIYTVLSWDYNSLQYELSISLNSEIFSGIKQLKVVHNGYALSLFHFKS